MRFERFKTLSDMVAYAAMLASTSTGKVCAIDTGCYAEGVAFRPCVFLSVEGGEEVCLRWYAFADQPDIDHMGKRARVEARDAAAWFQDQVQAAINAAERAPRAETMVFDPSTADALQIIKRSIVMHPSLFRDAVETRRKADLAYAAINTTPSIVRSIEASAKACTFGLKLIEAEDVGPLKGEMGAGIILLDIACKLQCLPSHVRTSAAVRTWES